MKLTKLLATILSFAVILFAGCDKNDIVEEENGNNDNGNDNGQDFNYGSVEDVDGNIYNTVVIGEQEWMAENLRTSKYKEGSTIPGISDPEEWFYDDEGAYFVLSEEALGTEFDSYEQFVEIYGKHYNWFTINNNKGLCPDGWRVPTDDDWSELENYLMTTHNIHNDVESNDQEGVGNYLKSCRQNDTPLGGGCETEEHPYWKGFENIYGVDYYGFSALPAGEVSINGYTHGVTGLTKFWSYSLSGTSSSFVRILINTNPAMASDIEIHKNGLSVRCMRDVD